jgi:hypothetical protein
MSGIRIDADYIAAVSHKVGEKYSPNLHAWLVRESNQRLPPLTTALGPSPLDGKRNWLMVGWRDEQGWFMGTAIRRILCDGLKTESYAYAPEQVSEGGEWFIAEYLRDGRCTLDRDHSTHFLNAKDRYHIEADYRTCNWCGERHSLRRWSETVDRSEWVSLP